jgi:transcriptional regulator with XRE-family HTH domain
MRETQFAQWFAARLAALPMTVPEFRHKSGFSSSTVSQWLNAKRVPSPASCDVIADVLHVDRDKVLALAGHRPPDVELAPDDPIADLNAMLRRIAWDDERIATIRAIIGQWYDRDLIERKKKTNAATGSS